MIGTRIQIACGNKLVAEVIVEDYMHATKLWAAYACLKYKRDLPMGCCVMNRADIPRLWDVRVGSFISH
jgi:hypothetical protein